MTESTANYTVEELVAMSDDDFQEVVTDDLRFTGRHYSPFQDPAVIRRTLTSLIEQLWYIDGVIAQRAEDPACSTETYRKTLAFRRHLLAVLDVTERRASWLETPDEGRLKAWRRLLHEVCDEIDGTPQQWILDDLVIPFPMHDPQYKGAGMTLRAWREIRIQKDPKRALPVKEVA
jgi:hypothetical protein